MAPVAKRDEVRLGVASACGHTSDVVHAKRVFGCAVRSQRWHRFPSRALIFRRNAGAGRFRDDADGRTT
jgi:hypothetical protein